MLLHKVMDTQTAEAIALFRFLITLICKRDEVSTNGSLRASGKSIKELLNEMRLPQSLFFTVWRSAMKESSDSQKYIIGEQRGRPGNDSTLWLHVNEECFRSNPLGLTFDYPMNDAIEGILPHGIQEARAYLKLGTGKPLEDNFFPFPTANNGRKKGSTKPSSSRDQEILDFIEQFKRRGVYRSDIEKRFGPCRDVLISLKRSGKIGIVGRRASTSDKDIFASGKYLRKKK